MVLSGNDLKYYFKQHLLIINPIENKQFRENGIDLILSDDSGIDLLYDEKSDSLEHGRSYLLCTKESLKLPNDLMGFVELRSTWARTGLIVPPTIIDAGFCGEITLEVFNGGKTISIPKGERFAHIVFAKLTNPTTPYRGKYQYQTKATKAIYD